MLEILITILVSINCPFKLDSSENLIISSESREKLESSNDYLRGLQEGIIHDIVIIPDVNGIDDLVIVPDVDPIE